MHRSTSQDQAVSPTQQGYYDQRGAAAAMPSSESTGCRPESEKAWLGSGSRCPSHTGRQCVPGSSQEGFILLQRSPSTGVGVIAGVGAGVGSEGQAQTNHDERKEGRIGVVTLHTSRYRTCGAACGAYLVASTTQPPWVPSSIPSVCPSRPVRTRQFGTHRQRGRACFPGPAPACCLQANEEAWTANKSTWQNAGVRDVSLWPVDGGPCPSQRWCRL